MKRTLILTATAALALSLAFAYGPRFQTANPGGTAPGYGMAYGAGGAYGGQIQAGTVFAGTVHDEAAALLGITADELVALHQDGKSLADIAAELGQDPAAFEAALVEARDQAIDEAVQNGELTEAQAAFMKTRTQAIVAAQLQREVGPNVGFAYGPARGAQAYGQRAGRAVGPAGAPGGYGAGPAGVPYWQDQPFMPQGNPNGRMGRR